MKKKKKNTKKFLILFPTTFTQINQIMNKKDPKYFIQKMKRKKKNQKMNMKEPKELYSRNEKKKKKSNKQTQK